MLGKCDDFLRCAALPHAIPEIEQGSLGIMQCTRNLFNLTIRGITRSRVWKTAFDNLRGDRVRTEHPVVSGNMNGANRRRFCHL